MLNNTGATNVTRRDFIKKLDMTLMAPYQAERLNNLRLPINLRKKISAHIGEPSEPPAKRQDTTIERRCYICPAKKDLRNNVKYELKLIIMVCETSK
ncbi:hypothetical protein HHI36_005023 [Cryptolaemus montrouzieri]|uniref:Uncharacterized protein n=1 Tax=Cryptolaemus montrouzieri TaxID=559131 RepID=A0ABD2NSY0_9CUCU